MSNSLKIKLPHFNEFLFPLAFGGASISGEGGGYGFGSISQKDSESLLEYATNLGVNVLDTAPIYGFGISESRIGQFIRSQREKFLVISKSGVDWHSTKRVNMTNDPKSTSKMLIESLRRLDSEYIDLYMIHWPDKAVDIRRPMEILAKARREGKIKMIGLCNTNESDLKKAFEIDEIHMVQSEFNLFNQESITNELFPVLNDLKIPFMGWGPLDKGILNLSITPDRKFEKDDCRSWAPWWDKKIAEKKSSIVIEFKKHLKESEPIMSFLMKDYFNFKPYSLWLAGAKNQTQWDQALSSFHSTMSDPRYQELKMLWLDLCKNL